MTDDQPDIRAWLQSGRSAQRDWLAANAPQAQISETMVAMANAQGGTLVIGVVGKEVAGVEDVAATTDHVLQAAFAIDPALLIPLPQVRHVADKTVLMVQIPRGMPQVYAYQGRYLLRAGGRNQPLSPVELRQLMMRRGTLHFEAEVTPHATPQDIDWEKVRTYIKNQRGFGDRSAEDVLLQRGCLIKQGDDLLPTNAGILLFGKDPQRYIRGADITAARFAGAVMGDTFSRQDITGTLPDQIRRAETFLVDHLRKDVRLRHTMARQEDFEYPLEAARELVVNAVAHRDYSINGDGIRLFIFNNRMEITSAGNLPGPVTVANIRDERFSRNPIIVQVLSDMGFIERLGYGVDRVLELMRQHGLQPPDFIEREGGFHVILHGTQEARFIPVTPEARPTPKQAETSEAKTPEPPTTTPSETPFKGSYEGTPINPRQEAALNFLHQQGQSRITNSDLKAMFPDVHPETIRRDLVDLVNKAILVKMGQKRGSYYVLKADAQTAETQNVTPESAE